jgi:hypothetical protein
MYSKDIGRFIKRALNNGFKYFIFLIFVKMKCNLNEAGRLSSNIASQIFLPPVPPAITPVLTPSLGGFLTPVSASVMPVTSASVQVCNVVVGTTSYSYGQFSFLRVR